MRWQLLSCCRAKLATPISLKSTQRMKRLLNLHVSTEQYPRIAERRSNSIACICSAANVAQVVAKKPRQIAKFCSSCGGPIKLAIPADETEWRHVCVDCNTVMYYNPKMVVGVICEHEGKILLCKRGIEPCRGLWTVPAGYMEMGESSAEGAVRETMEEARAAVEVIAPYAHFDIPRIGQSYVLFRAKLLPPFTYGPTAESLETEFWHPNELPLDQVAFSSVSIALRYFLEETKSGSFKFHHGVIEKAEGAAPNDPSSYRLRDHMEFAAKL